MVPCSYFASGTMPLHHIPLPGDHAERKHQRCARQRGAMPRVQGGELPDPEGAEGAFAEGGGDYRVGGQETPPFIATSSCHYY